MYVTSLYLDCNTYIICNADVRTMSGGSVQVSNRINEATQTFRRPSDDGHESVFLGSFKKNAQKYRVCLEVC